MRALVVAMLFGSLAATPAVARPPDCPTTATKALVACVARTASARRACTLRSGARCTDERAAAALGRKVRRACTETAIRDAGLPRPFDPALLADRLAATCRAAADAFVTAGTDALGTATSRRCLAAVTSATARLGSRTLAADAGCALEACPRERVARRIDTLAAKARRAAARACRSVLSDEAVAGALERTRARTRCVLAVALPATATCAPSGIEALVDLWRLPVPRPGGTQVAQVASYDRTGGNADLGLGPDTLPLLTNLGLAGIPLDFSYLYTEGGRFVVFDETGPGVVWRIWMTGLDGLFAGGLLGDIAFELDDEPAPGLTLTREALFDGANPPFLAPLAADAAVSSGGFFSAVPIPFARRLRITTSTVPNWLQISFTRLPPDQVVASFDPTADRSAVVAEVARAGDPATAVPATGMEERSFAPAPGASETVWTRDTPGTIVGLEVLGPAGADVPTGLRLRITFDGEPAPQVDAPLDEFFGASLGAGARSIAFGRDGDRFYCWYPMPFRSSARVEVHNDGAAPLDGWRMRVSTVDTLPPGPPMHFAATATAEHVTPDGHDVVLLERAGAGHVVGVVMTVGCSEAGQCQLPNLPGIDGAHLEGDERIAVDGSRWPQWHGTGLEDFFGGGFYFVAGAFALPTHGNPVQAAATSPRRPGVNLRSVYRVLVGDAMPYESGIRFAIEHGPTNDVPADFSSVVFHYVRAPVLAETDRFDVGDAAAEAAHGLAVEERTDVSVTSAFRGDASDVPSTAAGIKSRVTRFRVAVDPANRGVRLRRLADLAAGRQTARVFVNGAFAGVWRTSDVNPFLRWAELDFELPAALTRDQTTLDVEIDARDSPTPWTAFSYAASSRLE